MNDLTYIAVVGIAVDFFFHALPFLVFGIAILRIFRKTAAVFITLALAKTALAAAAQYRLAYIREMRETGVPSTEIVFSWQSWLPNALSMLSICLLFLALISLAVAIKKRFNEDKKYA